MKIRALMITAISVLQFVHAAHADDNNWYAVNMGTYRCDNLTALRYPFNSPAQYITYERKLGAVTSARTMPNVPLGIWVEVSVEMPSGETWKSEFMKPEATCETVTKYEIKQGIIPDPKELR